MSGTVDFYKILEVNKQATADEIKVSYKKLARVWHPDKNPDPEKKTQAETKFKEISQAYDVLKDPDKRKAYDWELEDKAYKSMLAAPSPWNYQPTSSFSAGWTSTTGFYYHERYPPNNCFRDSMPGGGYYGSSGAGCYDGSSFGSSDNAGLGGSSRSSSTRSRGRRRGFGCPGGEPRKAAHFGSSRSSTTRYDSCDFGEPSKAAGFGGSRSSGTNSSGGGDFGGIGGEPRKAAPVEHVLLCTLEELYNGGAKEILITRKIRDASGKVRTLEEKEIIDVKPGWKKGTRIIFPERGDQLEPGVIPADVVYEVDEIPHHVYKRDGDNLIAFHQITKAELNSGQFFLPTLDGKKDLVVTLPNMKDKAGNLDRPNEGMPISREPGKKGNLRITYWVEGGGSPIKRVAKSLTRSLTMITCFRRRNGVVC